jgi:hypothetical protein
MGRGKDRINHVVLKLNWSYWYESWFITSINRFRNRLACV